MPEQISYTLYTVEETYKAPTTAGIYAWMLARRFPPRLAKSMHGDELRGALEELERFSHDESIRLSADDRVFGATWTADVRLSTGRWISDFFSPVDESHERDIMDHLSRTLLALAPVLYVGKANNLRRRLDQHVNALQEVNDWEQIDHERDGRNFAQRARQLEIPPDLLRFTYFEHPISSVSAQTHVEVSNENVERIVNKILKPRLGRR